MRRWRLFATHLLRRRREQRGGSCGCGGGGGGESRGTGGRAGGDRPHSGGGVGDLDDDDDDDELLDTPFKQRAAAPILLPGQVGNCAACGKHFTVSPFSRNSPDGGLLCTLCGKELAKERWSEEAVATGSRTKE
ncbi:hypothetical protein QBC37DRAFT_370799 [Rhypophila decipiens]|uniref:DNA repair protein rhp7 treble clef domain-containing protein n=1 Tax=Rhypophila decipiens TaxID=261697 RepID=A0AAN7BAM5_9PEZI|nr:hypothetical protein QBC37DRAFT_370799 [Rhypophila decipiens]